MVRPIPISTRALRRYERGSALMLMPAAVMIVVMLLGIAVDESRVFLARRERADRAATAANDAVTRGLDLNRFRADGTYVLSPAAVEDSVAATLAAADVSAPVDSPRVSVDSNGPTVTVTLTANLSPLLRVIARTRRVEASSTAFVHLR